MSKVVHLSDNAHALAKVHCKQHGIRMSDWVASLIELATAEREVEPVIERKTAPVAVPKGPVSRPLTDSAMTYSKKRSPVQRKQVTLDEETSTEKIEEPVYAGPPFWKASALSG